MTDENNHVTFRLNVGNLTFDELVQSYLQIKRIFKVNNWGLTDIIQRDIERREVSDSEFDPLKDTPFANTKTVYYESLYGKNVPRVEVYAAVVKYTRNPNEVIESIDQIFPEDKFGDELPETATINFLFNEYLIHDHIEQE